MSRTHRRGTVSKFIEIIGKVITYNRYWMHHDPAWYRRKLNRKFRRKEKQYFRRFHETLVPTKNRGYYW